MALAMPYGNPTPAQQGQYQAAQNQLGAGYQQYLGRDMNANDFASQTSGGKDYQQNNVNYALNNIKNSEEARAYAARQNQPQNNNEAPPANPEAPPTQTNNAPSPQGNGSSYPSAPNVPASYGPNIQQGMAAAASNAPAIQSGYKPLSVKEFQGQDIKAPVYKPTEMSQFQDPRNAQVMQGRDQLLLHAMQNPESMSQQWQDQTNETAKDSALAMAKQLGMQSSQGLVGRGHSLTGGVQQAATTDIQSNLLQQLLAGQRNTATQAATQNFADRLNVLNAGETGLTNDVNRGASVYQNTLGGQQAQAGENQFAANYGLQGQQAEAGNIRDNYGSYLSGQGVQDSSNANAERFRQSAFGLSQQARDSAVNQYLQGFATGNNADLGWANYGLGADQQVLNYIGQGY